MEFFSFQNLDLECFQSYNLKIRDDWSRCDTRVTVMLAKNQISDCIKVIAYILRNQFFILNNRSSYIPGSLLLRWHNRDTRVTAWPVNSEWDWKNEICSSNFKTKCIFHWQNQFIYFYINGNSSIFSMQIFIVKIEMLPMLQCIACTFISNWSSIISLIMQERKIKFQSNTTVIVISHGHLFGTLRLIMGQKN